MQVCESRAFGFSVLILSHLYKVGGYCRSRYKVAENSVCKLPFFYARPAKMYILLPAMQAV